METDLHNDSNEKKKKAVKKETRLTVIGIAVTVVTTLIAVFLEFYDPPIKENKIVVDNRVGGKNQMAVRQLAPVQSFLSYLGSIEHKDSLGMWDQSTDDRKKNLYHDNKDDMFYDYFLTSKYEVQYIIPKAENNQFSKDRPDYEQNRSFGFFAILRFEDDVSIDGEVPALRRFHTIEIEKLLDSTGFKSVMDEVYDFVDCRFVIDSEEYVRNELKDYMMKMSMKDYVTQDWRFPINFVKKLGLKPKADGGKRGIATNEKQGHTILCNIVMTEENGVWKVNEFKTVAISRW